MRNAFKVLRLLLLVSCAAAQERAPAGPQATSGYVLGPDDELIIRVLDGLDLGEKPVLVGVNGNITLPLIGRVKAANRTVEELESELVVLLKPYVQDPQVSVTVAQFRSQPVSVLGAVTTPGVVQLRGRKSLYEVLSAAGGPRETAGSTITIARLREAGPIPLRGAALDATGRFTTAELDVRDVLEGNNPAANIEIKPHDVISVSQANSRIVYVVGDVQRAGAFTLGAQKTFSVLAALSMAGGLGRTAKPDKGKIFRLAPDGQTVTLDVNLRKILAGKAENLALRPEDVLVVPTSSRKVFTTYVVPATIAGAVSAAIYAGTVR